MTATHLNFCSCWFDLKICFPNDLFSVRRDAASESVFGAFYCGASEQKAAGLYYVEKC